MVLTILYMEYDNHMLPRVYRGIMQVAASEAEGNRRAAAMHSSQGRRGCMSGRPSTPWHRASQCVHISGYLAFPGPSKTLSLYQPWSFHCERLPGATGQVADPGCQASHSTHLGGCTDWLGACPLGHISSPSPLTFSVFSSIFFCLLLFLFLLLLLERGDGSIEINTVHPNGNTQTPTLCLPLLFSLFLSPLFPHVLKFTHNVYYHFFELTRLDYSL